VKPKGALVQSSTYELLKDFSLSCGVGFISLTFLFPYPVFPVFLPKLTCLFTANLNTSFLLMFETAYLLYLYALGV